MDIPNLRMSLAFTRKQPQAVVPAPLPVPAPAHPDDDTQPFRVISRPSSDRAPQRGSTLAIAVFVIGLASLAAAVIAVRSMSATPADPPTSTPVAQLAAPNAGSPVASPMQTTEGAANASPEATETSVPSATETPTAAATATMQPSSTPSPIPTETPTATFAPTEAPTRTPSPSPSPSPRPKPTKTAAPTEQATAVVSTEELVENGDFEDGDASWYLENGARSFGLNAWHGQRSLVLPAVDGYADQTVRLVPGATYTLAIYAYLGSKGDTGEVSIHLLDANGDELSAEAPKALTFRETAYAPRARVFTAPDEAVFAKIVIWKPAGDGIFVIDDVSLRATPRRR